MNMDEQGPTLDAVIIGAGFGGLRMLHQLLQAGHLHVPGGGLADKADDLRQRGQGGRDGRGASTAGGGKPLPEGQGQPAL